MNNLKVRCKSCGKELISSPKVVCCGCPNMTTINGDKISAVDLSKVIMMNSAPVRKVKKQEIKNFLTDEDIQWQEERKNRKVRKLNFEIR